MTSQRTLRTGISLLSLAAAAALVPAAPAVAAPAPRADLEIHLTSTDAITRGNNRAEVHIVATVDNVGAAAAEDATIRFQLPAGTTLNGEAAWQCDAAFVCTYPYGPVPAGGTAEPLSLYLGVPDGPIGTDLTIGATVSTNSREETRTNNAAQVQATYGVYPDLVMLGATAGDGSYEMDVSTTGADVFPTFTVENRGSAQADDLRVVVDLPAGATVFAEPSGPTPWQCDLAATPVVCVTGPLYQKDSASLTLPVTLPAGVADDRVAIHAKVTTSSPDWEVDSNDEASALYHYVAPAV